MDQDLLLVADQLLYIICFERRFYPWLSEPYEEDSDRPAVVDEHVGIEVPVLGPIN